MKVGLLAALGCLKVYLMVSMDIVSADLWVPCSVYEKEFAKGALLAMILVLGTDGKCSATWWVDSTDISKAAHWAYSRD
jgi:hypothetical protein